MKTPSRKDVAIRAGVSETIVSYVINNNRAVAADKRARVLEAVKELHYSPDSRGRALKGKSTGHILFIADKIENEYFGRLVHEIDAHAYDKGYIVTLMAARSNAEFVQRIISRRVDAVVISSASMEEKYVQDLIDAGVLLVLLMNRDYSALKGRFSRIYTGNESGIMAATHYLFESGCRHLCYVDRVSTHQHFSDRRDMRFRGFCNQMEALSLNVEEKNVITHCTSYEEVYDNTLKTLEDYPETDGFVCRNDHLACVVMAAVKASGKRIPEDVSVFGFDNSSMCTVVHPMLSSIDFSRGKIAEAIMELIEIMMNSGSETERHFTTQLVLRGTTKNIQGYRRTEKNK